MAPNPPSPKEFPRPCLCIDRFHLKDMDWAEGLGVWPLTIQHTLSQNLLEAPTNILTMIFSQCFYKIT
ncbi:hypothetical protein MTR67_043849 [Solanum verrucosum]|uniref:Uncharacterized protein n=1 Tax=Solanum verrucosum TaxID=315347 RepID=A0AAF0ZVI4_SOLVR|nr:hypothetical protein MTR67_043849 [Solanum verrucosum]